MDGFSSLVLEANCKVDNRTRQKESQIQVPAQLVPFSKCTFQSKVMALQYLYSSACSSRCSYSHPDPLVFPNFGFYIRTARLGVCPYGGLVFGQSVQQRFVSAVDCAALFDGDRTLDL